MSSFKVGIIVGSISSTSINRSLAGALAKLAPESIELVEVPIKELPFYSPDYDGTGYPEAAQAFKETLRGLDGVIIATPEYSRSIPGVLKNALDWAARPYGQNSFTGKPTAVIGGSMGPISTAAAQQHLKAILSHFDAPVLGQPEGFIQITPGLFAEDGSIAVEATAQFLRGYLAAFERLLSRYRVAVTA